MVLINGSKQDGKQLSGTDAEIWLESESDKTKTTLRTPKVLLCHRLHKVSLI